MNKLRSFFKAFKSLVSTATSFNDNELHSIPILFQFRKWQSLSSPLPLFLISYTYPLSLSLHCRRTEKNSLDATLKYVHFTADSCILHRNSQRLPKSSVQWRRRWEIQGRLQQPGRSWGLPRSHDGRERRPHRRRHRSRRRGLCRRRFEFFRGESAERETTE